MNAWTTTLNFGTGWAISQIAYNSRTYVNDDSIGDAIKLVFTPTASARVRFSSAPIYYGAQKQAYLDSTDGTGVYSIIIQFDDRRSVGRDRCTPVVSLAVKDLSPAPYVEYRTVAATSTESAGGYSLRPLVVNAPFDYPSGYEGEFAPTELPLAKYVAMGDSFSGAEGNPSFDAWTDNDGVNECHRSPVAYPRLLQASLELGPMAFVACGGATTANILGGQWNEPPQLDALSDETEVITVTIGGNNVGVSDYILGCVVACGPGTLIYNAMMDSINQPAFKENLVFTFEDILDEALNADLYVADYPHMAAEDATSCQGLDFSGAYDVQEALNGVIHDAVIEVGLNSNRIFMVKTNYPGSPFEGGYLCNGGDSLFNGLVPPPNMEYSLHPDAGGHGAYADVFAEYIG
jgi:hypothetical protein